MFWECVKTALFWYGLAFVIAAMEIESEGKWGWADKAPTWYNRSGRKAIRHGYG